MSSSSSSSGTVIGGISFLDALTLLFIALKLCKVIDWSWWWVLAPFWGQFALVIVALVVALIFYIVVSIVDRIS